MIQIRELRNLIAHEYANDKLPELYRAVLTLSPALLAVVPKVVAYANELIGCYPDDGPEV